jgi:hypothetical protein
MAQKRRQGGVGAFAHVQADIGEQRIPKDEGESVSEQAARRRDGDVFGQIDFFDVGNAQPDGFHHADFAVLILDFRQQREADAQESDGNHQGADQENNRNHQPIGKGVEHPEKGIGDGWPVGFKSGGGVGGRKCAQTLQVMQPEFDQVFHAAERLERGEIILAHQEALGRGEQRLHL